MIGTVQRWLLTSKEIIQLAQRRVQKTMQRGGATRDESMQLKFTEPRAVSNSQVLRACLKSNRSSRTPGITRAPKLH